MPETIPDPSDPVELMAREIVRLRFEHRVDSTIRVVTEVDREEARRVLRSLLLGSGERWHLVQLYDPPPGGLTDVAVEWTP